MTAHAATPLGPEVEAAARPTIISIAAIWWNSGTAVPAEGCMSGTSWWI
jgi:hypothetical protein